MSLQLKTSMSEIDALLKKMSEIYEECLIEEFTEWAKRDDEYLRSNNGFINRSGNLRSSLGAGVLRNAKIVFMTPFETILNGMEGSAAGQRAIEDLASETVGMIAKAMVAGMDYAQMVEDIESKDVLESRRIQCEREAENIMARAAKKAEQRINKL